MREEGLARASGSSSCVRHGGKYERYYFSRRFRYQTVSADKSNFKTDYAGV